MFEQTLQKTIARFSVKYLFQVEEQAVLVKLKVVVDIEKDSHRIGHNDTSLRQNWNLVALQLCS